VGGNQEICLLYHIIRVIVALFLLLTFLPSNHAARQAAGELTVTAVVASSVSVTFAADGTPVMLVANASPDADAVARASSQFSSHIAELQNKKSKHVKGR